MIDVIKALSQTSLPGILAFAGVVFIFLSIGGKLGAQIITTDISKRYAGIIGSILLLCSLVMFVVSATIQPQKSLSTPIENASNRIINSDSNPDETYNLRPTLPTNIPISQVAEIRWTYLTDESTKCTLVNHKEYIITILGRDLNGDASVAKRKTVSDLSTDTCIIAGKETPQVTKTHGDLEGIELLAHKTAEGIWFFDELPGATEKQKYAMMSEGFIEPFAEFPKERVSVGKVILFKDQDVSLALGIAFPGKKEGTVAMKFDRVIMEREPVAQLSVSMDISMTTLVENNEEVFMAMTLNGGVRLSLLENTKLSLSSNFTGIIKAGNPASKKVITGPATVKLIIKEL